MRVGATVEFECGDSGQIVQGMITDLDLGNLSRCTNYWVLSQGNYYLLKATDFHTINHPEGVK